MLMVCCSLLFCICFVASRLLFCGGFTWFLAAGLAVGIWKEEEIFASREKVKTDAIFRPLIDEELRKKRTDSWFKAVERTFSLADLSI
ncbi:hypothetical protein MANES_02G220960v8 [Manihot esculenta]|uniref:Uncharacterized protein n=1 Tax=Manihot esculenta TaxID=3983 RepID=A0ACB7I9Z7_MANES|nr:hypothetical protein MANES_02G220960v8 [Manihot esculenta]